MKKVIIGTTSFLFISYFSIISAPKIAKHFLKKENIDFDYNSFTFIPNFKFSNIKVKKEGKFDMEIEKVSFSFSFKKAISSIFEISNLQVEGIRGTFIDTPKQINEKRSKVYIENIIVKNTDIKFIPENGTPIHLEIEKIESKKLFNLDSNIYGIGIHGNVSGKADGNNFIIKSNENFGEWEIFCPISLMKKMDYKFSLGLGFLLDSGNIKVENKYQIDEVKVKMKWKFSIQDIKQSENIKNINEKFNEWINYFNDLITSKSWELIIELDNNKLEDVGNDYFKDQLKKQSVNAVIPNALTILTAFAENLQNNQNK